MHISYLVIFFTLLLAPYSFSNASDASLNEPLKDLSTYIGQGLQEGIAGGVSTGLAEGIPAAINAGAESFKNQFEETGDAHQGISNIFKSLGNQFEHHGEGRHAMQNFFGAVSDELDENGQGRKMALNAADTTSAYVNNVGKTVGSVITNIVIKNSLITVLSALGIATMWYGSKVLWNFIERKLKQPTLIIESSRKNVFQRMKGAFTRKQEPVKRPMIFEQATQERLQALIETTKNINTNIKRGKKNIAYRNLLLYGPPGTGKTLFAQQLAQQSNMEFAITSGASFSKKGALEAMDDLFAWANKSKGLILFIDEAESLMPDRNNLNPDSDSYRIFTSFLNYTGTRSNRFMIVMATNRLNVIDEAMHRRIDDLVELSLPEISQRIAILQIYRDVILFDTNNNEHAFAYSAKNILTNAKIEQIAAQLEGFSNGDLEGLINMIKTDADSTPAGIITESIVDTAVTRMLIKHATLKKIELPNNKNNQTTNYWITIKSYVGSFFDWVCSFIQWPFATQKK